MSELKVGMLGIATLISIIYMSMKVTTNQSGFGDYVTYKAIVEDASGIFPKTPIKVAGISAGRIKKIELSDGHALLTFELLKKIKLKKDAKLKIKAVGFLGDKYIEVKAGSGEAFLSSGAIIPVELGGGVENLVKDVSEVMKDVKIIVTELKKSIAPEGQPAPLKAIMNDIKELVDNTKKATASLNRIMQGNEEKINGIVKNLNSFSKDLAFQTSVLNKESAMSELKAVLKNARTMSEDMKSLLADVKSGKGTIGKLLVDDEIADEVTATLAGIQKIIGKVDAIRTELGFYTGVNTLYGGETTASLTIFPSPERFYILGITTSEFGPEISKYTNTTINGAASDKVEKIKRKNSYRFNIQIGRKIQDFLFRGGVIESTGGFGVEYLFQNLGTKVIAEVFDYRKDIGVNLRLSTEMQLWNVFYGKVAVEDILEDTYRSATFSAGLKFNDEDLKGLIGFFL